jgi:hypothetical protein
MTGRVGRQFLRPAHDVKNLFVCDTSVFVTWRGREPDAGPRWRSPAARADHIAESARRNELN